MSKYGFARHCICWVNKYMPPYWITNMCWEDVQSVSKSTFKKCHRFTRRVFRRRIYSFWSKHVVMESIPTVIVDDSKIALVYENQKRHVLMWWENMIFQLSCFTLMFRITSHFWCFSYAARLSIGLAISWPCLTTNHDLEMERLHLFWIQLAVRGTCPLLKSISGARTWHCTKDPQNCCSSFFRNAN